MRRRTARRDAAPPPRVRAGPGRRAARDRSAPRGRARRRSTRGERTARRASPRTPENLGYRRGRRRSDRGGMTTLHIENTVHDYDAWKGAFDKFDRARRDRGVRSYRISRSQQDDAKVLVDLEFDNATRAEEFARVPAGGLAHPAVPGSSSPSTPSPSCSRCSRTSSSPDTPDRGSGRKAWSAPTSSLPSTGDRVRSWRCVLLPWRAGDRTPSAGTRPGSTTAASGRPTSGTGTPTRWTSPSRVPTARATTVPRS